MSIAAKEIVLEVTYELTYGGIICHMRPNGTDDLVATSLTHVRIHRSLPFAAAVMDYQRHRRKKLRKRQQRPSPLTLSLRTG